MSRQNVERVGLLKLMVPELFDSPGTVLYVGAYGRRFSASQPLYQVGHKIVVLEIWAPFMHQLLDSRFKRRIHSCVLGDVCDVGQIAFPFERFDHSVWLQGPEHVERERALSAIEQLEKITNRTVVLGCPWGNAPHGVAFSNPFTEHKSHWYASDFQELGYRTAAIGPRNKLGSHLLAWKFG